MTANLPTLLRPDLGNAAALNPSEAFTALAVGSGRELARQVGRLLEDAGLNHARLVSVVSVEAALARLAAERPRILFLGVTSLELASLRARPEGSRAS
jgi:hypothetical protein